VHRYDARSGGQIWGSGDETGRLAPIVSRHRDASSPPRSANGEISVIDTIRWLTGVEGDGDVTVLLVNPVRPGRVEPRVVKRRPKQYRRLTEPRAELRKKLPLEGF
jgi:hypothetical protein